jgi:hypothetical protein
MDYMTFKALQDRRSELEEELEAVDIALANLAHGHATTIKAKLETLGGDGTDMRFVTDRYDYIARLTRHGTIAGFHIVSSGAEQRFEYQDLVNVEVAV